MAEAARPNPEHNLARNDPGDETANRPKTLQKKTAAELDVLLPSILHKAFRGMLT
jgi:hypothetical protein